MVAHDDLVWELFAGQSLEVVAVDAVEVSAHTAYQVLHGGGRECEDCGVAVIQHLQLGDSSDKDVRSMFAENKAVNGCWQLDGFAIDKHAIWCEQDDCVFHLDLD